ncbi:MAG: hypothetical protein M5U19_04585 [Microthrixaceae bacterium]|nr:hypothetical protein [Microthrixaceae bacterium]
MGVMRDLGYQVFLDLKLFDIPTQVNRSRACSAHSAWNT